MRRFPTTHVRTSASIGAGIAGLSVALALVQDGLRRARARSGSDRRRSDRANERAPRVGARRSLLRARETLRPQERREALRRESRRGDRCDRAQRPNDVRDRLRVPARRRLPVARTARVDRRELDKELDAARRAGLHRRGGRARTAAVRHRRVSALREAGRVSSARVPARASPTRSSRVVAASSPACTSRRSRRARPSHVELVERPQDPRSSGRRRDEHDDHEPGSTSRRARRRIARTSSRSRSEPGYVPHGLYWDTVDPYHYIRVARGEERPRDPDRRRRRSSRRSGRSGERTSRGSRRGRASASRTAGPAVATWSGQVQEPHDGMAYIGALPRPRATSSSSPATRATGSRTASIAGLMLPALIAGRAASVVRRSTRRIVTPVHALGRLVVRGDEVDAAVRRLDAAAAMSSRSTTSRPATARRSGAAST